MCDSQPWLDEGTKWMGDDHPGMAYFRDRYFVAMAALAQVRRDLDTTQYLPDPEPEVPIGPGDMGECGMTVIAQPNTRVVLVDNTGKVQAVSLYQFARTAVAEIKVGDPVEIVGDRKARGQSAIVDKPDEDQDRPYRVRYHDGGWDCYHRHELRRLTVPEEKQ